MKTSSRASDGLGNEKRVLDEARQDERRSQGISCKYKNAFCTPIFLQVSKVLLHLKMDAVAAAAAGGGPRPGGRHARTHVPSAAWNVEALGSLQVSRGFGVVRLVISHFNQLFQLTDQFPVAATSGGLH